MLPSSGTGTAIDDPQPPAELPAVGAERRTANEQILSSLTEDRHASELLKQIWEIEVPLGRMSAPVPVSEIAESLDHVVVNRRFGVEQGTDANGDTKIRSVDDCTESLVNAACAVRERLHHDGLDSLVQCAKRLSTALGHNADLSFFKADVDAAYRRVPVASSCLNLVWIVFLVNGITWASCHRSLAFGLVAAVHAWNRVGACLTHICRQLLRIPLLRYVDDLFAVEPSRSAPHALGCVARVIRAVLGTDALRAHKMAVGNYSLACQLSQWTRSWSRAACAAMQGVKVSEAPLIVLGASVSCLIAVLRCCPSPDKAAKWSDILLRVIATGIMSPGLAKKMAGRLSWAAQTTFRRAGRAMVRPFFASAFAPLGGARAGPALLSACHWWLVVLRSGISEAIPLRISSREPVILLTDARGLPAHTGAVLYADGHKFYTALAPPASATSWFSKRADNQIMGLEIFAVVVALSTFWVHLQGRSVIVFVDNTGGEHALLRGSAKSSDHNALVHGIWTAALLGNIGLWFERVSSRENIADLPSREEYELLKQLGATWVEPSIDETVWNPGVPT